VPCDPINGSTLGASSSIELGILGVASSIELQGTLSAISFTKLQGTLGATILLVCVVVQVEVLQVVKHMLLGNQQRRKKKKD